MLAAMVPFFSYHGVDLATDHTQVFAFGYALEVLIATKSFHLGFSGSQLRTEDMIGIVKVRRHSVAFRLSLTLDADYHGCCGNIQDGTRSDESVAVVLLPQDW